VNIFDSVVGVGDNMENDDRGDSTQFPGIVYYIIDRELSSRAKIGRTRENDVKQLKSRYSIFGYPFIFCCYCDNIRTVEKELKTRLFEAGCMNITRGKESVVHSEQSLKIFTDVVQEYHIE
jgi:hypothetical protein